MRGDRTEYLREYWRRNKKRLGELNKKYRAENKCIISSQKKRHYSENRSAIREAQRQYRIRYKEELWEVVVSGYGGKCERCEERRVEALLLHHRNGKGVEHRRMTVGSTSNIDFWTWVIRGGFPEELELLCGTCHLILHRSLVKP